MDTTQRTEELVDERYACPSCGESRMDWLVWIDNDWMCGPDRCVECQTCGQTYDPDYEPNEEA